MDDLEPEPGRAYRPLNRTPPEYQTVIKFLLMASILDSVWVSGPAQTGSPCGLARRPGASQEDRPQAPPHPDDDALPGDRHGVHASLPEDVRETLRQLNITAEDCDPVRLGPAAPTVLRVLGVALLNAFVFWSDFGAALVAPRGGVAGLARLAPPACRLAEAGSGGAPLGGPGIDAGWAARLETGAGPDHVTPCTRAPGEAAQDADDDLLRGCGAAASSPSSPPTWASDGAAATAIGEDGDGDLSVPLLVQLFYLLTLMAVIVGTPRCPPVFENACTFLMC